MRKVLVVCGIVMLVLVVAVAAWWLHDGSGRIDDDHDRIIGTHSTDAARGVATPAPAAPVAGPGSTSPPKP